MARVVRPVGYTGGLQQLVWPSSASTVTAYLWGAGGGGGGDEGSDDPGGNGGGGGWAQCSFSVNPGDVITVAVGRGGSGGTRTPGTTVGTGGLSLASGVFNTRSQGDVVPVSDPRWSPFMNAHAVWDPGGPGVTPIFRTYTVNFPVTGYYVFQYSADNSMTVQLDGVTIISYGGFSANPPPFVTRLVTAGNHTLNITATNAGDVAGVALTADISFSGANGGRGSAGSNGGGSGGGGGGATVLLRNTEIIAVAGGGAGGGGAGGNGNTPGTSGPDSPGPWGWPGDITPLAQDGQPAILGGGGGGAGGGLSSGNGGRRGGASPSDPNGGADRNATAGSYGETLGPNGAANPSGRTPGGTSNAYYTGVSVGGLGGSRPGQPSSSGQNGTNGYAVFELDIPSDFYVRDQNVWSRVNDVYVRSDNVWREVKNAYVRNNNQWQLVFSTDPPTFAPQSGGFFTITRTPYVAS